MKKICLLVLMLFLAAMSYANEDMAKGTKQYKKQNFQAAIENFSKAQTEKPKDVNINYNLACAYYKAGQYDKALDCFDIALNNTQDSNFKSAILYNMGNSAYKNGDKDLSLNYYKSSLKLNSSDMQTKHNIEFIQSENSKDNEKNKNKNDKNQNKDKKQNQDKQNQQDKNKNGQNKDDKQDQDKDNKKQQPENKQSRHLLDYFDEQDKQNHDKAKDASVIKDSKSGKNW